ncbi:uncharacterized protein LOC125204834 [Salvia hispanica]|uniref:uncharacterized protein LOC125204834 n=1 Tax=Salvia hispanica TaxID=49212 RepID=UPI0020096854|nr:uncharacterized protein LOC125204834 [Salvia hispanica]XP_047959532.1 uncharacterized protein LOC125204834 [Salvia hispanica]XP_047959534.1 uncharacterized protein LOC125204834 [Salvia hispanica]
MASIGSSSRAPSIASSHQSPARLDDHKIPQCTVSCVYQTHIAGYWRNVTAVWSKNLIANSLSISVESVERDRVCSCKLELKPWYFWSRKGSKTFMVDENQLELYWDLRSAKFSGPEPSKDFYVALVFEEELVLLLGDMEKKAHKATKARPSSVEALMYYKEEHVFGKKSFSTRLRFDESKEHDVVVESSTAGDKDPEMWISIDGIVLIHIRNLQWKFRGNQTVVVNKHTVQVLWDVYAWLFCPPGVDHGLFIFKPGGEGDGNGDGDSQGDGSDCSGPSMYYSARGYSKTVETCYFLYAWKTE